MRTRAYRPLTNRDGGTEMRKLRAAFFAIMILTSGIEATTARADRSQQIKQHTCERYTALAKRRLLVGQLQPTPHPRAVQNIVLATLNDLMACYMAHRQTITASLADGNAREG